MTSEEIVRLVPFRNVWPIGFAFQALWTPLIVRQSYVNHGMLDIHLIFYGSFGLFSLLVFLIFIRKSFNSSPIPNTGICVFGMLCELIASVILTVEIFAEQELIAFLGCVIGACGLVASMLVWGNLFKRLPLLESMAYILIAYMVSFFFQSWCYMLFPVGAVIVMPFLAISSSFCLIRAYSTLPEEGRPRIEQTDGDTQPYVDESGADDASDKRIPLIRLLVAFAVYSFVLTLRRPVSFPLDNFILIVFYGIAVVITVVIYWRLIVLHSAWAFELMIKLLLAAFTVGFFMGPFAPEALSGVPPSLFVVATALIYMLVWMAVVETMHLSKMHPFAIVGIWGACYGCPRLLFYVIGYFIPLRGGSFEAGMATALVALFCLFIVLFLVSRQPPGFRSFFHSMGQSGYRANKTPLPFPKWEGIAQEHGLTERESEVFYLVCEGYSRRYVAEILFISENTVKAHLKRIYAKMGIHSKYDLEKMIRPE